MKFPIFLFIFSVFASSLVRAVPCDVGYEKTSGGEAFISFPRRAIHRHSMIVDTNLAAHLFYSRLFSRLSDKGISVFHFVRHFEESAVPIVIGGRVLTTEQAQRLSQIVHSHHRFRAPEVMLKMGLENHLNEDGFKVVSGRVLLPDVHNAQAGFLFPQRVISEILNKEHELDVASSHWRPKVEDGLVDILYAPLRTPKDGHNHLGNISTFSPVGGRNSILYRDVLRLLEEFQVGGGEKGKSDREIVADVFLGQRSQELLETKMPPILLTHDLGIVRGLLHLKLSDYIKDRQRREVQVKQIMQAIRSNEPTASSIFSLFGKTEDFYIKEYSEANLAGLPADSRTIRVVVIEGITIRERQLSEEASDQYWPHLLQIDLMFFQNRSEFPDNF